MTGLKSIRPAIQLLKCNTGTLSLSADPHIGLSKTAHRASYLPFSPATSTTTAAAPTLNYHTGIRIHVAGPA